MRFGSPTPLTQARQSADDQVIDRELRLKFKALAAIADRCTSRGDDLGVIADVCTMISEGRSLRDVYAQLHGYVKCAESRLNDNVG